VQKNLKKLQQESPDILNDLTSYCGDNKSGVLSEAKKSGKSRKEGRPLSNNYFETLVDNNQNITFEDGAIINAYYNLKKNELLGSASKP
jgi:hypothetical protein